MRGRVGRRWRERRSSHRGRRGDAHRERVQVRPHFAKRGGGGTIDFTNEDDAEHNFTAEEAGIDEDVDPSGSTTIDLGDVEAGSYDFFCEYHKDTMTGTLEVTG